VNLFWGRGFKKYNHKSIDKYFFNTKMTWHKNLQVASHMIYITRNNRVIGKVGRLGRKNGQFRHNRASNTELGMKILQNKIIGTQISFSTNFGGKLSSILSFLFAERLHCRYLYNYYKYSRTLNDEFQHFILRSNKFSLLCRHHRKRG
jgi:hypothetical protein